MKLTFILRFTLLTLLLTSCSAPARPTLGTATPRPPTPTPILSPTPVWFPPTETPTSRASILPTATPDWAPGIGVILATDDFRDPADWSDLGVDYVRDGRMTLSATPGNYQVSLHQEILAGDFYAEITARLHLCRGADEYGFLVRAIPVTYYRFALTCEGQARAERVSANERILLQPPILSGDAPRGSPSKVRIAVWAAGREMRFFLNGLYQFTINDATLRSGTLGVFVRAAGDTPVTVLFSDLVVREVDYRPPTPSP